MKRTHWIGLVMFFFSMTLFGIVSMAAALPVARIGIVTDGPCMRCPALVDMFKKEIHAASAHEFDVKFPADKTLDGSWTVSGVRRAIQQLLASPDVDLILALGDVASNEISKRKNLKKPVIAPFVIDAEVQKLPHKAGTSGVKNLNYINTLKSVDRSVQTFGDMVPFSRLAIMTGSFAIEAIPALHKLVRQLANEFTLEVTLIGVETSADAALQQIPDTTQAVFVGSLLQLGDDEFQKLVAGLTSRKLPSFAFWGRDDVEQGLLASMVPKASRQHLARSAAVNVVDVLRGEDAGTLPVAFSQGERLTINMATARAIGIYPSWRILTDADLLNEDTRKSERFLTLDVVVQEAIKANLDLAAAERNVLAGAQRVMEARSVLFPQIDIGANYTMIDEDRAEFSNGTQPERLFAGTADATQLIYSDGVWSNYTVEKHLQDSRLEDWETLKLDIIQISATAYLNVLSAKNIERIQKDNLKLTRENLERARIRVSIGAAGPEEVYRWESEIANSRQAVLVAESLTLDTMSALNRILNRPLKESFIQEEINLRDPLDVLKNRRIFDYFENAKVLQIFRDFLVAEGLLLAPELRGLDAAIAARERTLVSSKREFWLPTFALQGNAERRFDKSGEGSDLPDELDDTLWTAGVYAKLPLFTSGGKTATYRRTREELSSLKIERDAVSNRIEERIFNAVHLIRASYPGIWLSRDAVEAAQKNLALVTDSYSRGIKSIIDLVDAQNQYLVDNQKAANAVFGFLIDLLTVQRAMGKYVIFLDDTERNAWFEKLESFSKKSS
ncbi:MAG: TolC family protein [Desulfobulbaceae bacterium]|nr:TolC family protein [Desulfobulbaceae bacterium]